MKFISRYLTKITLFLVVLCICLLSANVYAGGEKTAETPDSGWEFDSGLYLWGASIGGTSAEGDDIDIKFTDLVKDLDLGLMALLGARKDKWTFAVDVLYLDVEDDANDKLKPAIEFKDIELQAWILTPTVGYTLLKTDKVWFDLFVGARYLWLEADLEFDLGGEILDRKDKLSETGDFWDGIVGVRGQIYLSPKWYVPFHLDVGTGDTDFTWHTYAGLAHKFEKIDVIVVYRYMDWDFDDDNKAFDDLNLSGPLAGVKYVF